MSQQKKESLEEFGIRCTNYLNSFVPDFKKCFVAGGFFPRFYHNIPIRDIDVYVNSDDIFIDIVKEYSRVSKFEKILEHKKYFKFLDIESGITIDLIGFHNPKNQRFLCNFDFKICRFYSYESSGKVYVASTQASDFFDLIEKKICFTGRSLYRATGDNHLLTRLKKYLDLGFKIDDNEMTKIYRYLTGPDAKKYTLEQGYA